MNDTVGNALPENYDAHETLKPNEVPFTIQGGDPIGPPTVLHWVELARKEARRILDGKRAKFEPEFEGHEYSPTDADMVDADVWLRKATSAESVAWQMVAYQKGQETERPVEQVEVDPDQTLDIRKLMIRSVGRLNNSLAEANEIAIMLDAQRVHRDAEIMIREAVEQLRAAAQLIDPRRGSERS